MNSSPGLDLTPPLWLALCRLKKAHDAARRLERSPWDFAVEIHVQKKLFGGNGQLPSFR
jgi:hypothetical protein